ncbi:MAG: DRTGG domain-containing protein [Spirochaetales bacterium]
MKLETILQNIPSTLVVRGKGFDEVDIQSIVASDLMSDVLTVVDDRFLVVTSLNSEQVIRTADIVGAPAVMLVNGKHPQDGMVRLAQELGITLLSTPLSTYKVCYLLGTLLESR